ncbi:Lrp/AsnC family transcriptional regulator [Rhizobium sp. P28RR-XV]|uniref:Lrp/AsnC family transcriptional regulator n=1 Tax=Rhizobium sp. P28RR-XV TaxID=2726737 RepID=UPI001456FEBD|nr:Lrp/AsnC family transcriptional regulator [Rhizobium sp. P28RR-XV]NLR88185.1 Lrp/AsnC family transcriptional regulator [Rhizobium sp. P28RR-XV]
MPLVTYDEATLRILELLQQNAELSVAELAAAVGLSSSPCWRRVNELKETGVVKGAVTLVDASMLGLAVNVFVHISLKLQDQASLEVFDTAVKSMPEVMECYLMTGESDYLLRIVVEDIRKYQSFVIDRLTTIPCVSNIRSSFALGQIKYTTALPIDHLRKK